MPTGNWSWCVHGGTIFAFWNDGENPDHLAQMQIPDPFADIATLMDVLVLIDSSRTSLESVCEDFLGRSFDLGDPQLAPLGFIAVCLRQAREHLVLLCDLAHTAYQTRVYGYAVDPANPRQEILRFRECMTSEPTNFLAQPILMGLDAVRL